MNKFAYLVGVSILLLVWLLLFLKRPYRREMLVMSLIIAPLGITQFWYLKDYWEPKTLFGFSLGIENFLFSFGIGGIAAVIYEEFRGAKLIRTRRTPNWLVLGTGILLLINFVGLIEFFGVNSMYATYTVFLLVVIFILMRRKDLLFDAIGSGVICGFVGFILYLIYLPLFPGIVKEWWKLSNLSGILILGIPFEELLFAFGFGMVAGPFYEFWQGYRLKIAK